MTKGNILKIILYAILIIILLSIMVSFLFNREYIFSFGDYDKVELHNEIYKIDDVNKLNVNMVSTDVTIKYSEDDNIRVMIYGKENRKDRYSITNENNNLEISEKKYSSFCFGFCFYNEEVIVYLPKQYNKDIKVKGTSSDVNIMNDYDSKMNIETVSGEIKLQNTNDLIVKTTSGDISINRGKNIKVETTSGDINIEEAEDTDINTTSGDTEVGKCNNVNITTVSGDVGILDLTVNGEALINTISGDVKINKINDVYVETKTTSGDIRIDNNNRKSDNTLKVKTVSGDIIVG